MGYYGITLAVHVSVRLSSVRIFTSDNNVSKCQWIFTKLGVCIDIVDIWFGIVNVQILSIFDELSARDTSVFSFPDDNFSKCQWIFTKFGVCIDIVQTWFGVADGQISSIFDKATCLRHICIFISGW